MQFAATDSWQDLLDYGWPINVAGGADPDESKCDVMVYLRGLGEVTVHEVVEALAGDEGRRGAVWFLLNMPDSFPDECRGHLVDIVCEDPPIAAITYRNARGLRQEEHIALWDAFAPSMPVAREMLAREIGDPRDG